MLILVLLISVTTAGPAEIKVTSLAGTPIAGATLRLVNVNGPSSGLGSTTSTTDASGVLTVTQAQLLATCPPPPPCPPGAPCARPPECAPIAIIEAKGFLPMRVNPFNTPQVRLVPETAKVATEAAALAAVKRDPRWKAWVGAHGYGAPVASLERDGNWRVRAAEVSWPSYLPPQTAMVDAISAKVTLTSCPVQGAHLVVGAGPSFEDLATGYRYQCDGEPEPRCAPLLRPGTTLVVGSYGLAADGCGPGSTAEGRFEVGTHDGAVPPVECSLEHCHRAK